MDYQKKLDAIISKSEGKVIDVFYEMFSLIVSLEEEIQVEAFQYLCENVKSIKIDESETIAVKEHFTEEKLLKYIPNIKERFFKAVKELTFNSSKNNVSANDLYKQVWNMIISNKYCKTKHEKALATFIFVDSDFIPYKAVGTGISLEEDTYFSILDSLDDIIKESEMITQVDYEQKTQQSSLLVERINSLDSFEKQSVFMATILDMVEENIKSELKRTIDSI